MVLLNDFHAFLGDAAQPASPVIVRMLKEQIRHCRSTQKVILITGCLLQLPPEIEKELTIIEHHLPGADVLAVIAESIAESAGVTVTEDQVEQAAEAASGLTTQEAEDVFALSVVQTQNLDAALIAREKAQSVKKSGLLEIMEPSETLDSIGGLDNLKGWLQKRRRAFSKEAIEYGLPSPKGVLILGIPGTGKSLTAKATSAILGRPILKLDAGKLFAGIVGESEANLRRAIQMAEAIAPAILWIDELEKAFAGSKSSSSTDGGTSARVFGSFLSWLQDKTSPVFVVSTANDVSQLPPELLRKGRWDELFFVDLPSADEREAIWRIQLAKHGRDAGCCDVVTLAERTNGYTGSEIEQCVIDAMYDAFDAGVSCDQAHLECAIGQTVPLSQLMADEIKNLRKWADGRARPANASGSVGNGGRKLVA